MTFKEIFNQNKVVLSFEFFPPKSKENLPATKALILELSKLNPDFMTVTYGAAGGTRELTKNLVSYISQELKKIAVAHLTCVNHITDEITELLNSLADSNVSHVLALRGDKPVGSPEVAQTFNNAQELTSFIKDRGDFSIAVAGYPEVHKEAVSSSADIDFLKSKVEAGAEVIFTQLFFDNKFYFEFVEKCLKAGINIPIVPGIMPVANFSQLKRFTELCGASIPAKLMEELSRFESQPEVIQEIGTTYAIKQCTELLKNNVPGIHLYTLNKTEQVSQVVQEVFKQ